jgi:pimeloyl-ACP methyl ester carboxylesterase
MQSTVLDGVTLDYEVGGVGDPVVLIHLAPYADSFLPLMDQPELASYQLIRYRRRGYGSIPNQAGRVTIPQNARDLADLLRFLGIGRAPSSGIPTADWSGCNSRWTARTWLARWC